MAITSSNPIPAVFLLSAIDDISIFLPFNKAFCIKIFVLTKSVSSLLYSSLSSALMEIVPPCEFVPLAFAEIIALFFTVMFFPDAILILPAFRLLDPSVTTLPVISTSLTAFITIAPFSLTRARFVLSYSFVLTTSLNAILVLGNTAADRTFPAISMLPA